MGTKQLITPEQEVSSSLQALISTMFGQRQETKSIVTRQSDKNQVLFGFKIKHYGSLALEKKPLQFITTIT